jgi:uncharacterized coiled-coil DUF342 family protein
MKTNLLTNLLIVFTLGLCGLSTFQWVRESESRKEIQKLHNSRFNLESEIQQHTNTIRQMDGRIAELNLNITQLEGTIATNELQLQDLQTEANALANTNVLLYAQIGVYTNAYIEATNRLTKAFADIKKQNELIDEVAAQRDEFVEKLNSCITERNEIVTQYNDLVKKVEEFQSQLESAAQQKRR